MAYNPIGGSMLHNITTDSGPKKDATVATMLALKAGSSQVTVASVANIQKQMTWLEWCNYMPTIQVLEKYAT